MTDRRGRVTVPYMSGFLRAVKVILAGGLVLVVGAYLIVNTASTVAAAHKRSVINHDLTARLASAVPAARIQQADVRAAGAGLGAPQVSWLAQDCSFPTSDAGWMVQSYRQSCGLTALTAWRVDSEAVARAALRAFPESLVGSPPGAEEYAGTHCLTLARASTGETRETTVAFVPPRGDETYWCGDVYRPAYLHRIVDGDGQALDPTAAWLVVQAQEQLGEVDLGCSHWSVLFCGNPFGDKPAVGDLPVRS